MAYDDPYKVLGVSRDASDEDVKHAYRELVKKYHPDKYAGNPLADLVEEKMKDINDAYDRIEKERKSGAAGGAGATYGAGAGSSTGGAAHRPNAERYNRIRAMINAERYSDADLALDAMTGDERGAEWHFLKGCVLLRRGSVYDANRYIDRACYLDPANAEYRAARENVRASVSSYSGYKPVRSTGVCDMCSGLLCADCLCEACGGDLIRCC